MAFAWMTLLSVLVGALSRIRGISGHICTISKHSTVADCTGRGLSSIPRDLPPTLISLDVSNNPIKILRNGTFKYLTKLDSLYLDQSSINTLELQAFDGLGNLCVLNLDSNDFTSESFPSGVFGSLRNLESLKLKQVPFSYVTDELNGLVNLKDLMITSPDSLTPGMCTFKRLNNLEMYLQYTPRNDTFDWFRNTPIKNLTLSFKPDWESSTRLNNAFLLSFPNITNFRISKCYFQTVTETMQVLTPLHDLKLDFLAITHNMRVPSPPVRLTRRSLLPVGNICIRNLDLTNNQIGYVEIGSFSFKYRHCLESINLSNNLLVSPSLIFIFDLPLPSLKSLDLSSQAYSTYTRFFHEKVVRVSLPPSLKLLNISFFTAKNLDVSDMFIFQNNTLEILDITGTNIAHNCKQTLRGLNNLKHLNVSHLQCSSLPADFFQNYTSLEEIVFRNSQLNVGLTDEVSKELLNGLTRLKYVDLSENNLDSLHDNLFTSQRSILKRLILADNRLTSVPNIKYLSNITALDLTSNVMTTVGHRERLMLEKHRLRVPSFRLLLKGNPFECNCQTSAFIEWVYTTRLILDDPKNYTCTDMTDTKVDMISFYNNLDSFKASCIDRTWLILSICTSLFFILTLVSIVVGYRYRVSLQYFCLVIRRQYRGYQNIQGDTTQYKYDAFVAYNYEDYRFVCNDLLDHIEKEMNFKLCLHHRDFQAAVDITDNIMDAISESKWIIIVITKSFLSSTWGQFELEMSRRHMFQRNSSNMILIFLEDIDKVTMPKALYRIYNQITCLEHPGRKTYLQWKDTGYTVEDLQQFWTYLQNTLHG